MFFVNFCVLEFNFLDIFVNFTCAFVSIIINPSQYGSAPCWHDLGQFSSPGSQNPVFCPVFQKVHILNLYVMGSFWIQKFYQTNFINILFLVLIQIGPFQTFFSIHHIFKTKMIIDYLFNGL